MITKISIFFIPLYFLILSYSALAQNDTSIKYPEIWSKAEAFTPTKIALPSDFDSTKAHTLLIALHGYGGTAESFLGLSEVFTDAGIIFAAPEAAYTVQFSNGEMGYEWFLYDISSYIMLERPASEMEKAAMRTTAESQIGNVINDLKGKYLVDKVYLTGFSQGGIITYLSGIHHHDKVDGMIIFSSVVDPDWLGNDNIKDGNNVRCLIIQGTQDKAVPIKLAENGRDLLIENGYDVSYKTFEGKHTIPGDLLPYVIDWIEQD